MRSEPRDEDRCQARIYSSYGYHDRCANRHKEEREGYQLCGLHARRFDQGHEVEIADKSSDTSIGFHMLKKDTIQKTFENEDEKRYELCGCHCEEVNPDRDGKTKWLAAEPDKGMILCNALEAVERRRQRAQYEYEGEMERTDRMRRETEEELERWKKGEPEPEMTHCEECVASLLLNEERERGMCNKCAGTERSDVNCMYCDDLCDTSMERRLGVCDTCQAG